MTRSFFIQSSYLFDEYDEYDSDIIWSHLL